MFKNKIKKITKVFLISFLLMTLSGCKNSDNHVSDTVILFVIDNVYAPIASLYVSAERMFHDLVMDPYKDWSSERKLEEMEGNGIIPQIDRTSERSGVDKNNNRIRDDVDQLIKARSEYPQHALVLERIARGFQEIQESNKASIELYRSYRQKVESGTACLMYHDSVDGKENRKSMVLLIDQLTANTEDRKKWKSKVDEFKSYKGNGEAYICDMRGFMNHVFSQKK